ncbi:hypothetical protein BRC81_09180 [Halobacteriales archaeon QS_1_68_20]|nr:MAG: hypothetical protein BRC81_09180 [Halobacteriales archaeon QS_1_68_20]
MTRRLVSTRRSTDAQPTATLARRSDPATELLVLAATLAAALATAWVATQPLLGLATLTGLALLSPAVASLRARTPRPGWLAARARR